MPPGLHEAGGEAGTARGGVGRGEDAAASGAAHVGAEGGARARKPAAAAGNGVHPLNLFWEECMKAVDRPSASKMVRQLAPAHVLGIDPAAKGVSAAKDGLYSHFAEVRGKHPTKVLLVRVGDFYEAYGYCAVLLVQYAGLNPMGTKLPRAGCPVVNLRRTLGDLTRAGFSVAVSEELPLPYGAKNRRKQRYVAGVTSPASPLYVHDMSLAADAEVSALPSAPRQPAIVAVGESARGLVLYEISIDMRAVKAMEGLTLEGAVARVAAGGCSPPLYLDKKMSRAVAAALVKHAGIAERSCVFVAGSLAAPASAKAGSFLRGVLDQVRLDAALPPNEAFSVVGLAGAGRPRPLYVSTAAQIGLLQTAGIPSLVEAVLGRAAEAEVRRFVQRLLLHPPPPAETAALASALAALIALPRSAALPVFPIVSAATVSRFILAREANNAILADVHRVLMAVNMSLTAREDQLAAFAKHVLVMTRFETGLGSASGGALQAAAHAIIADIENTLVLGGGQASQCERAASQCEPV